MAGSRGSRATHCLDAELLRDLRGREEEEEEGELRPAKHQGAQVVWPVRQAARGRLPGEEAEDVRGLPNQAGELRPTPTY